MLAVTAFLVVLTTGEFTEEATMLTSVECTCALPVAFGQVCFFAERDRHRRRHRSRLRSVFLPKQRETVGRTDGRTDRQ